MVVFPPVWGGVTDKLPFGSHPCPSVPLPQSGSSQDEMKQGNSSFTSIVSVGFSTVMGQTKIHALLGFTFFGGDNEPDKGKYIVC